MKRTYLRSGFTMIELLFVIVVLGIVGTLSLDTIRQYYESIFRNQEYSKRVAEADHILEQLSKYFENAISVSIVNLDRGTTTDCYGPPVEGDTNDYTVAFIGVDTDSLGGTNGIPGWNEETRFQSNNEINASDSNYNASNSIIEALTDYDLNGAAVYDSDSADQGACVRFGFTNGNPVGSPGFHRIDSYTANTLSLNTENNATHGHRKYLLRSAYAFRVQNNASGDFIMYTDFRPWEGERYTGANAKSYLLGRNVAHFYADYNVSDFADQNVTDRGLVWRLKVCMRGVGTDLNISDDQGLGICRERRVHVRY